MGRVLQDRIKSDDFAGAEPGLTEGEARATLRRQLIGSVVAAIAVVVAVGLTAMRPGHEVAGLQTTHLISAVQQPAFVAPEGRVIALRQH